ncbi:MAG: hypothetical protein IPN15_15225 [Saprospiraceae bacterium]|nr:hypothetical protein [Candidatus Vicinibacter affinis]
MWGLNKDNVWAVGRSGTILKYDGNSWIPQASGTTKNLASIWGADINNIWVAGATILNYNGNNWSQINADTTNYLYKLWGVDKDNIWPLV